MTIYILDCSTTGLVAGKDEVIQLATIYAPTLPAVSENVSSIGIDYVKGITSKFTFTNNYFYPSVPVTPEAYELHGLSASKLLGYHSSGMAKIPLDTTMLIGHNILFNHKMLGNLR